MTSKQVKKTAFMSHLSGAINKLNEELTKEPNHEVSIVTLVEQVTQKYQKVTTIANEMQEAMTDDAELEADINKMDEVEN